MKPTTIVLEGIGKRFGREWIFRKVDHTFEVNDHTVIRGHNGSGKSTLLQVILGSIISTEGTVSLWVDGKQVPHEEAPGLFSIATPYLELIEEFTLLEMLDFHRKMVSFVPGLTNADVIRELYLEDAADKAIRHYSSGMKQRVKLGMALLSDTPFVLLDEPTSNLDSRAIEWYQNLVSRYMKDRVIIVCSNDQPEETGFCTAHIDVADFKSQHSA